jgi:hypothetical protein
VKLELVNSVASPFSNEHRIWCFAPDGVVSGITVKTERSNHIKHERNLTREKFGFSTCTIGLGNLKYEGTENEKVGK